MEIYHQYIKLRKQFGRHPKFADEGAEMIADIRPNEEHAKEYIPRNPVITVTQCAPEMSEHDANTVAVILASKAMSHVEGGWPKDVDYSEAEHTIRYRKKVEKDEDYIKTVTALGGAVQDLIKQNNAIDIYEEYFTGQWADHSAEVPSVKTITVFKDPSTTVKRSTSYVNWHPDATIPKVRAARARTRAAACLFQGRYALCTALRGCCATGAHSPAQPLLTPPLDTPPREAARVPHGPQQRVLRPLLAALQVVVSYAILQFQQQPVDMPLSSYVWDVNNPNTPEFEMAPTSQVGQCVWLMIPSFR